MVQKSKREMVRSPKGMHDMLPQEMRYQEKISRVARKLAEYYGFLPIETPHVEHTELFLRPLGETSDVVQKEMYTFRTKGGDSLTLRPEGTAPIMRAYAEHGMNSWPQPVKLYYEGSFFRHESPQRGRFREFRQFSLEILGETDGIVDALIMQIMYLILQELGFKNILIHINSLGDKNCRPAHRKDLVAYFRKKINYLCKNCKRRVKENPLRILDCKEPSCIELKNQTPQMVEYLCGECKTHFKSVLEYLDETQIPYLLNHSLVRGFDYYSRTVFEIFLEEEAVALEKKTSQENKVKNEQDAQQPATSIALCGGGRYDDLMALLGQKPLPAFGASLGIERIIHEMKRLNIFLQKTNSPKVFLIQIGPAAKKKSLVLLEELRAAGIQTDASLSRDNLKAQLTIAAKVEAEIALILGQKEAMENTIIMRDMREGIQETILQSKLIEKLKARFKGKK